MTWANKLGGLHLGVLKIAGYYGDRAGGGGDGEGFHCGVWQAVVARITAPGGLRRINPGSLQTTDDDGPGEACGALEVLRGREAGEAW